MFTLKYEFPGYQSSTLTQSPKTVQMTLDTSEATLDELFEFFEDFLRANGYCFDGHINLVNDEARFTPEPQDMPDYLKDSDLRYNENVDTDGYQPAVEESPSEVQMELDLEEKNT